MGCLPNNSSCIWLQRKREEVSQLRIVVADLTPLSRKENLCDALGRQNSLQIAKIIKRPVIQYCLNQQFIANISLRLFGSVPKEIAMFVDEFFPTA